MGIRRVVAGRGWKEDGVSHFYFLFFRPEGKSIFYSAFKKKKKKNWMAIVTNDHRHQKIEGWDEKAKK